MSAKTIPLEGLALAPSALFFGTAMGPMLEGRVVDEMLDEMAALGINAFDTARGYQGAEKSLGHWIKARDNRGDVVVLSKCGNVGLFGRVKVNKEVISGELEKSLKALGTDYIDIYLLHRDDPKTPVGEMLEALWEAKDAGKIRLFGVSNWTHERIAEANAYAAEHGMLGFSISSPHFSLAWQREDPWGGNCVTISGPEEEARAWYRETQLPVLAYSSLGRGFFSGKFSAYDTEGAKKVLDVYGQKGYLCEENMARLSRAEKIAERDGCTVSEVALRYIFSCGLKLYAVISTQNPERMRSNLHAADWPLSPEDVRYLEKG